MRRDVADGRVWTAQAARVLADDGGELAIGYWPGAESLVPTAFIRWLETRTSADRTACPQAFIDRSWTLGRRRWDTTNVVHLMAPDRWFSINAFFDALSADHRSWCPLSSRRDDRSRTTPTGTHQGLPRAERNEPHTGGTSPGTRTSAAPRAPDMHTGDGRTGGTPPTATVETRHVRARTRKRVPTSTRHGTRHGVHRCPRRRPPSSDRESARSVADHRAAVSPMCSTLPGGAGRDRG